MSDKIPSEYAINTFKITTRTEALVECSGCGFEWIADHCDDIGREDCFTCPDCGTKGHVSQ